MLDSGNTYRVRFSAIATLILAVIVATLWLPPDGDQALFYVSGQKVLEGSVVYRDFVDLKPPLIYYLNALGIGVFGERFLSIRILESLFQIGAILLIFVSLRRLVQNRWTPVAASLLYALLYFGMNFNDRAQVEGFAALPLAAFIFFVCAYRGRLGYLWGGVCLGLLGLLKTTFLILFLPAALIIFLDRRSLGVWRDSLLLIVGVLLPYLVFLSYLTAHGALSDYGLVQQFTTGYASQQLGSPMALVTGLLRVVPTYLARIWTLLVVLLFALGVLRMIVDMVSDRKVVERPSIESRMEHLLLFVAASFVLLTGTIVLEAKFLSWHFVRLLVPTAIIASIGVAWLGQGVGALKRSRLATGAVLLIAVPALIFSPVPRVLWTAAASISHARGGVSGFTSFYGDAEGAYSHARIAETGRLIRGRMEPGGSIFVASGWGGLFHFYAEDVPDFKIYHAGYLIAPYSPEIWKEETERYLLEERPQFVVLQNDVMSHISGTDLTSAEAVLLLPEVSRMLRDSYDTLSSDEYTLILERAGS